MIMKYKTLMSAAVATLLLTAASRAQVTLTDIGTAPTPGPNDISQLSNAGNTTAVGNLNFFWDDGYTTPTTGAPSQTFTTLNNAQGYILSSVAIQVGGLGNYGGNAPATPFESQPFALYVFQLSGAGLTNGTLVASYIATSQLNNDGDWMQWTGLGVPLAPGTNYAFAFGIANPPGGNDDWEVISVASGWPYTGGQICLVPNAGGKVKYSTLPNTFDMTFDVGLSLPAAPIANPPLEVPSSASTALAAGTSVSLTASAGGSQPITYQWQTDGGSGGALTNILGATNANLVVGTTGWAVGAYKYDFVASNSLGTNLSSDAVITIVPVIMQDIGPDAPTPGPIDISQLLNTQQNDDGFNYYTDNGANHNEWNGQTFTTGNNTSGYLLNSIVWKSAGNGNSFPVFQLYDLYIYSISPDGTTATTIASYQAYGGGTELDWQEWVGLSVPLAPNAMYAYAFGRDATSSGWEHIADQNQNPYTGGEICQIPSGGGTVTYGTTGGSDATFDLGLSVSEKPNATVPTYTPNVNPVYAGTAITLLETAVGSPPLHYQWLTDNGTGGALVPVSGANNASLAVSTTALTAGNYNYAIIVTNSSGASTSAVVTLNLVAASAPQIVTDISPATANEGYVGQTLNYSAAFTGTLPIAYQWMINTGSGPTPISVSSNPSAVSNTLVLSNLQLANAGAYTVTAQNSVGGPISSSASTLTVLPDPAPPARGTYGATILSNNPAAFWPFAETNDPSTGILPAYDASGHDLDGLYGVNAYDAYNGFLGPQPPAFPTFVANSGTLYSQPQVTNAWVIVPPLNLDTNAVTITMWINPAGNVAASAGLLFNRTIGGDAAGFCFGTDLNAGGMAELGYTWNTNSAATYTFHSGLYPLANMWSFVALVVQTNQAAIYLYYVDPNTGLPDLYSAANVIPHGPENFNTGTILVGDDGNQIARVFNGSIADVAVFKQALTSGQVLAQFSAGAGLGVISPSISGQPQSTGAYVGNTVRFTATGINGSSPLTFQWQWNNQNLSDGGNISGSTTPSLTISNVTPADAGSYQLLVENSAATTPSSNVTLTVVTPVPGSYESAILADSPYAFWKLDETNNPANGGVLAYDYVRGLNGTYLTGTENGFNGILGPQAPEFPGFPTNNTALGTVANTANSYVTASAGSATSGNLTYAMWIYPTGPVENWAGLLMDRSGPGTGLGFGGLTDSTGMSELGYTWNQNSTWSYDSYLYPPANQWSYVALVIQPTQATIYLINSSGVQTAVNAIAHDTEEFGVAWHIGDDAQGNTGGRTFPGSIADVSVYLTSLSSNQLMSLYNTGVGTVAPVTLSVAPGSSRNNLTLTWSQGVLLESTNVSGPWITNIAASPYTIETTNSRMFFRVQVKP